MVGLGQVIGYRLRVQTKGMIDMLESFSAIYKKTRGGALALLLAFSAPLSGLAQDVPAHNPDGLISISGTVERASADEIAIKPRTGGDVTTVKLVQPFHLYARVPGDLSHLKDTSFVGVTAVKQPDGTERASAIGILPEELRGVGEGSYMMNQPAGADVIPGISSAMIWSPISPERDRTHEEALFGRTNHWLSAGWRSRDCGERFVPQARVL